MIGFELKDGPDEPADIPDHETRQVYVVSEIEFVTHQDLFVTCPMDQPEMSSLNVAMSGLRKALNNREKSSMSLTHQLLMGCPYWAAVKAPVGLETYKSTAFRSSR